MSDLLPNDTTELRLAVHEDPESFLERIRLKMRKGENVLEDVFHLGVDSAQISVNGKTCNLYQWFDQVIRGDEKVILESPVKIHTLWGESTARLWVWRILQHIVEMYRLPQTPSTRFAYQATQEFILNPCPRTELNMQTARTQCNSLRRGGDRVGAKGKPEAMAHHLAWILGRNSIWKVTNTLHTTLRAWFVPNRDDFQDIIEEDQQAKEEKRNQVRNLAVKELWICLLNSPDKVLDL